MNFDSLLARADEETLQELLGSSAVRLMMVLDRSLTTPTNLRRVLLGLRSREELLLSPQSRTMLLELLPQDEAERLAQVLGLSTNSNVYEALKTLRIPRESQREMLLFNFFGLFAPAPETCIEAPAWEQCVPDYALFEHQRTAARRVSAGLNDGGRRVLLHMPTGSGKTRTAMNVIAEHLRAHEPALVVWLAYSEELCEQAASEFERAWTALGNRDIALHRFWSNHALDLSAARDGLVVAGMSKLYSLAQSGIAPLSTLGTRASLIIIDEAHQAIAPTYKLLLDALFVLGPSGALLGLTATPGRTWSNIQADQQLADFFDCHKVSLEIEGYENPVRYLVEQGYLARVDFQSLFYEGGVELSPQDWARTGAGLDIPESVLQKLAEDEARNLALLVRAQEMARRHDRMIVFAATVEHAHLLATVLRSRGLDANAVSGETPQNERSRLIEEFRSDAPGPKILCNFGVLTTGFDAPRTSASVIARPTKSLVLYSQMVGRVIRGPKAGGNKEAEIVTVVDRHLPGFGDVAEAFMNWEDVWS